MDTVAGTVNVTTPEALEAHQEIAAKLRSHLLELVGKPDCRCGLHAADCTEWPLGPRPFVRRNELYIVSGFHYSAREPF